MLKFLGLFFKHMTVPRLRFLFLLQSHSTPVSDPDPGQLALIRVYCQLEEVRNRFTCWVEGFAPRVRSSPSNFSCQSQLAGDKMSIVSTPLHSIITIGVRLANLTGTALAR